MVSLNFAFGSEWALIFGGKATVSSSISINSVALNYDYPAGELKSLLGYLL